MSTPEFDITLDHNKAQDEVDGLLALVKPDWKREDIKKKVLEDGHVNVMIACYVTKLEESIVVRVFGDTIVFPIHKKPGRETKTVRVMNELGLCVPIVCTFNNGYCMEFVHGINTNIAMFTHPTEADTIMRTIIRELARYHSNEHAELAKGKGVDTTPIIYENLEFALTLTPDFDNPEVKESLGDNVPANMKEELVAMEKKLVRLLREADMPVAFCHNDPNPTNIFYNVEDKTATFLDYESCGFNYAVYDFTYFLVQLIAGPRIDIRKHLPNKEYVVKYLRYYLECRQEQGDIDDVTDELIETWYKHYQLSLYVKSFWMCLVVFMFNKRPTSEMVKDIEKTKMWFKMNGIEPPETIEEIRLRLKGMVSDLSVNRFLMVKEELEKM